MPIRAPDPHNLRIAAMAARKGATIEGDLECRACGYNLRGLPLGSKCPECGAAVLGPRAMEIDDPLSLAPPRVIVAFIRGCWAASIIIGLVIAGIFAMRFPEWDERVSRWGLLFLSVLWVGAVIWLTPAFGLPQAISRGFSRRGRLRRVARWLQAGWVLAATARLLQTITSGKAEALLSTGFVLGMIAGLTGIVILSILLERLAEWARDDRAQNLFNWAMWTIPVATLLQYVHIPVPIVGGIIVSALWLIGVVLFPYALLALSGSVTLSVVHNYEHREREERRQERRREYQDNVARTVQTMDAERARKRTAEAQSNRGSKR